MRLLIGLLLVLTTSSAFAVGFGDLNMDGLSREVLKEKKELSGRWRSGEQWKGFLCQGEYSYDTSLRGALEDLEMEVAGEGEVTIRAEIVKIGGDASGSYRTSKLLCYPFHLGIKFFIDRVSVFAKATSEDQGSSSKIKVRVISTRFGRVHFSKSLSPQLEKFVTRLVNSAFAWLWNSKFGVMLSDRISEEINNKTK